METSCVPHTSNQMTHPRDAGKYHPEHIVALEQLVDIFITQVFIIAI